MHFSSISSRHAVIIYWPFSFTKVSHEGCGVYLLKVKGYIWTIALSRSCQIQVVRQFLFAKLYVSTVEKQTFWALTLLQIPTFCALLHDDDKILIINNEGLFQNSMRAVDDNLQIYMYFVWPQASCTYNLMSNGPKG